MKTMQRAARATTIAAAALGASALVAAPASAATVTLQRTGTQALLVFQAAAGERNDPSITLQNGRVIVADPPNRVFAGAACAPIDATSVSCSGSTTEVSVVLLDGNDAFTGRSTLPTRVSGGIGDDLYRGGEVAGRSDVDFRGGDGFDSVSYFGATAGVTVNLQPTPGAVDGRPGDRDQIAHEGIELINGSRFDDVIFGSDEREILHGSRGNDVVRGFLGADQLIEDSQPNGVDYLDGGFGDADTISYARRTGGVQVTMNGGNDDGAPGENDTVVAAEILVGSPASDTLVGTQQRDIIDAGAGFDVIAGSGGDDLLLPGAGRDVVTGGAGLDDIRSNDGERDTLDCGKDADRATIDQSAGDTFVACETVRRAAPVLVSSANFVAGFFPGAGAASVFG